MIVLDMDGVLANFADAACAVHGRYDFTVTKWDFFKDWGITIDEFWKAIHDQGDYFYEEMVLPYPWAVDVVKLVAAADEFVIMSSPSNHKCGYSAKKIWIDKYIQPHFKDNIKLLVGKDKHLLADHDTLLVDDYAVNIEKFRDNMGFALTFPQLWNCQAEYAGQMDYVEGYLKFWKGLNDDRDERALRSNKSKGRRKNDKRLR